MLTNDAIRACWLRGLHEVTGKPRLDIRGWLKAASYQVDSSSQPTKIVLNIGSVADCLSAYAYDINRVSVSASETCHSVTEPDRCPRSLAWLMIKVYYAAFFSAHALLRVQGISPSYFEIEDIIVLRRTADLYGISDAKLIPTGQYLCYFDPNSRQLTMQHEAKSRSHEFLWQEFRKRLVLMQAELDSVFIPEKQKTEVNAFYADLIKSISQHGRTNGNWLSHVRNAVNYRQEYDVWYPHRTKHLVRDWREKMSQILRGLVSCAPEKSSDEVVSFLNTCFAIIAVCRGTLSDMAVRCPKGKSFLEYGPSAFAKKIERIKR